MAELSAKFSETRTEPERDATHRKKGPDNTTVIENLIVGLCSHPSRAHARALLRVLVLRWF